MSSALCIDTPITPAAAANSLARISARAPGAHLAAGQCDDPGLVAQSPQFDDRPSAPEFHIVGMRTERDDVKLHCSPDSIISTSKPKTWWSK